MPRKTGYHTRSSTSTLTLGDPDVVSPRGGIQQGDAGLTANNYVHETRYAYARITHILS